MTETDLFRAIGSVDEDLVEAARTAKRKAASLKVIVSGCVAVAACVAVTVGIGMGRMGQAPQLVLTGEPGYALLTRTFASPMEMRNFFNYNGYRYAFLEDGKPYDLSAFPLTERLGSLDLDIQEGLFLDDNSIAEQDLATTYAVGGELYRIPGYDPAFRLAVVWEGEIFIGELVGRVDNAPMDADYYFQVSDLEARIRSARVMDHTGEHKVHKFNKKDAVSIVELLRDANAAQLSNDDYEAVARAQSEGRSWQLLLDLDDGTSIPLYVIPDLEYVSIGDDRYTLPAGFLERFGGIFDQFSQNAPPFYG